jgi:hypothetical protein
MKKSKVTGLISMLIGAVLLVSNSAATLVDILPESSHYDGSVFYDQPSGDGFLRGRIDFAVYDTELYPDEFVGDDGFEAPGEGRYIYAYQVFNDYEASDEAVGWFAVLGINESVVEGISAQDDLNGGVEPGESHVSAPKAIWEFNNVLVYAGDHSFFLVFSSEQDWVAGDYEIKGPTNDEMPVPSLPEPGTVFLLGAGFALAFARRR